MCLLTHYQRHYQVVDGRNYRPKFATPPTLRKTGAGVDNLPGNIVFGAKTFSISSYKLPRNIPSVTNYLTTNI